MDLRANLQLFQYGAIFENIGPHVDQISTLRVSAHPRVN